MRYEIILAPQAREDLLRLKAGDRAKAVAAIERYLRHEPEKVSKSRIKRLEGLGWPKYRLRIDNMRAFYDVLYELNEGIVEVLAVREKSEAMKWLVEHGRRQMLKVPLNEVKDDLSRFLRLAETENVIITRHGVPAGMLVGFENPEDWWEALLLRDDRFLKRISEARASLRAGEGITLEEFRAQQAGKKAARPKTTSAKKASVGASGKGSKQRKAISKQAAT